MTITSIKSHSIFTTLVVGAIVAFSGLSSADAQSRAERVAERRAAAEQRLQSASLDRAARVEQRTSVLETMAATTPEMVQARLSDAEEQIISSLVGIDEDLVALRLNNSGAATQVLLEQASLQRLTEDQVDALVMASARAATITADEVEALIVDGILVVEDYFDTADPEAIAAAFNEIGAEALDVQVEAGELRAVLQQYAPEQPTEE